MKAGFARDSNRDDDLRVGLGFGEAGHAGDGLDGAALLEKLHALEALEDIAIVAARCGAFETVVLGHDFSEKLFERGRRQ